MSTLSGTLKGHKFHGDPKRFVVIADFIFTKYGRKIKYIADVAGGQGMLTKILNKKYNYDSEVVDPRGFTLTGVPSRSEQFKANFADYYDLIIGLHPDEATIEVAKAALIRPTILIPCCNFWDKYKTLNRDGLLYEISNYYDQNEVKYEKVIFDFKGDKNIGLVSEPRINV